MSTVEDLDTCYDFLMITKECEKAEEQLRTAYIRGSSCLKFGRGDTNPRQKI